MTDFTPNPKFLVKHFLEIQEALPDETDEISFTTSIGIRGKAVIAAFVPRLFNNNAKDFANKIASMPMAASKALLTDVLNNAFKPHVTEKVNAEVESIDETKIKEAIKNSFDGKPIRFTITLPLAKKKVGVTPITELNLKKAKTLNRVDQMMVCVHEVDGAMLTTEGAKNFVEEMAYADFEFLYLFLSNLNANISKVDWAELLKNF